MGGPRLPVRAPGGKQALLPVGPGADRLASTSWVLEKCMLASNTELAAPMKHGPTCKVLGTILGVSLLVACDAAPRDLTTAQLSQVVAAEQPALKVCFDAALKSHPYDHEVRMQATIHIAPDGSVSGVELDGKGGLPGMSTCVRDSVKRWKFPQASDATHTSLPLIFKRDPPKGGPDSEAAKEMIRRALGQTAPPR